MAMKMGPILGLQTQMEQMQVIYERIETEEISKRFAILLQLNRLVQRSIQATLSASIHPRANILRNAESDERKEFDRLMVAKAISMYSKEMRSIMDANLKVNWQARRVAEMVEDYGEVVDNFLVGRKVQIPDSQIDGEMERLLLKLYERDQAEHFARLREKKKAIVRKLTPEDIDSVGKLYSQFQFTGEGVLSVALEHDTQETFLNDFNAPGAEGPTMREMLQESLWAEGQHSEERRREKETMGGYVITSDQEPFDIWGVCIYTKSPWNPAGNETFMAKNEKFLKTGISGGRMQYPTDAHRMDFEQCLLQQRSIKLFLLVGKEPGAADAVHTATLRNMKDVGAEEPALTYTMGGLSVECSGEAIKSGRDSGQNVRCVSFLNHAGYKHTEVSDEYPEGPAKEFTVQTWGDKAVRLYARPRWIHYKSSFDKLRNRALA